MEAINKRRAIMGASDQRSLMRKAGMRFKSLSLYGIIRVSAL